MVTSKFTIGFIAVFLVVMIFIFYFVRGFIFESAMGSTLMIFWAVLIVLFLIFGVVLISLFLERVRKGDKK